ncbi:MAG TPA: UDP-N-acetylmuramoyl-tripeptide--D-alanyl-D-alanine ligase [Acidimicrobiales bacterium]|nr:UDP-N-acetylmuramoyl-tripeptide--D-alanyl-D-alanine ligase [Acidimicrobiales bacterium]
MNAVVQHGGSLGWAAGAACVLATVLGGIRWLRVAQREHYLPDTTSRFALRWWGKGAVNLFGALLGLGGLALGGRWVAAVFAPAGVVAFGPLGLGLRGRTSPIRWTRRLRTLATVWGLLQGAVAAVGFATGLAAVVCAAGALAVPALVDMACVITEPFERILANRYVRRASQRLARVAPKVVGITGSYGKTSTKLCVAHLLSGSMSVVASPASFNNRAGLARAVNEHLADGTDVFVAEMGTYAPGEIAELCSWLTPDVAVVTAVGPVHLERFKSEEKILKAKSEILDSARCCVLVVDDPRLGAMADECESSGKRVWRVAAQRAGSGSAHAPEPGGWVEVEKKPDGIEVSARGEQIVTGLETQVQPGNVGCAVAVAMELGVPVAELEKRLRSLPSAPHRLESRTAEGGFAVLDDTYNANPAGTRAALEALREAGSGGDRARRVVVTPGMVELGSRQRDDNERFAAEVRDLPADLVVVGRTNRRALVAGYSVGNAERSPRPAVLVRHREQAVEWVRDRLGPGDAVLYENDLPDHYP